MQLSSNETWFSLEIEGGENFSVYAFEGREEISTTFEFKVELVSRRPVDNLAGFIGLPATLRIKDGSVRHNPGNARIVNGYVRRMDELHTTHGFTHYRALIVPRLWFLGRNRNFRIFQDKTILDIIDEVLQRQGFTPDQSYAFKLFKAEDRYKPRDYCVQYGESDLHFISRLCEEEGIYYYFEHTGANSASDESAQGSDNKKTPGHKLFFSNMPGGDPVSGDSSLRYAASGGMVNDSSSVYHFEIKHSVDAEQTALAGWNFEKPSLNLLVSSHAAQGVGEGLQESVYPGGLALEEYSYPGPHSLRAEGGAYAELALLRRLCSEKLAEGAGAVARLTPGYIFDIAEHPIAAQVSEGGWWATAVIHSGEQPQVLQEAAPERGMSYNTSFRAIPAGIRYLPPLRHHKNLVQGSESAIVNGPQGQEIHTDEYGRVKLRFHWDRRKIENGNSSCWVRVSQGWAGTGFGALAVPRMGHEVIVDFINGDPDRPIVTGRVYNADNMPPYGLDNHQSRTVFKSMSTPGGDGKRGFNELRVEDLHKNEEIYLHAGRDLNMHIEHDFKDHIQNDRHQTTDNDTRLKVLGDACVIVSGARNTAVKQDLHLTVSGSSHLKTNAWLLEAGEEVHLKAGMKVVIEAATEINLNAGGSGISINPAGVIMGGAAVHLGGGSPPGAGSGASPGGPHEALVPDKAAPPELAEASEEAIETTAPARACLLRAETTQSAFCVS